MNPILSQEWRQSKQSGTTIFGLLAILNVGNAIAQSSLLLLLIMVIYPDI